MNEIRLTAICLKYDSPFTLYQIWLHFKWKIYSIFWAELFWSHTATTKIGKVRIMPLFAAYGDTYQSFIYQKSGLRYFEIFFIFDIKSRLLFQKELTYSWNGLLTFCCCHVSLCWCNQGYVSLFPKWFRNKARAVHVKVNIHLNLPWNAEIGLFRHPLFRAPSTY